MIAVILLAALLQRHRSPSHVLAVALIVVLTIDPFSILSAGFWLSFAAVAIILLGMNNRLPTLAGWSGLWWRWGRLHVLVSIGLIPLLLILFQRLPMLSPLANFVAVPWVSLLVVPFVLLGTLLLPLSGVLPLAGSLSEWLLQLANLSLSTLWPLLLGLSSLPLAQWTQHAPLVWSLIPALLGTTLILMPRGLPGRWLGLIWLLPALMIAPPRPGLGDVNFTLLDVGQGLAAVTLAFIKAVNPSYALFPVGYRNRYHFPQSAVLQRYIDHGSRIYRTDLHGAITMHLIKGRGGVSRHSRDQDSHFWQRHLDFH